MFPEVSRARAASVCVPFVAVVVFQERLYGEVVFSAPSTAPSSRNCTPATPTSSDAVAETVTVPASGVFAAGAVSAAVGGTESAAAAAALTVPVIANGSADRSSRGSRASRTKCPLSAEEVVLFL